MSYSRLLRDYEPLDVPLFQALLCHTFPTLTRSDESQWDMIGLFSVNSHRTQLLSERYFISAVYIGLRYYSMSSVEWKFNVECMKAARSIHNTIWQFNLASWDYFHINTQHWRNCIVKDRSQWSLLKTLSSLCLSYCKITGHGKDQSKLVSLSFLIKLSHF